MILRLIFALCLSGSAAAQECRHALALGLDVSGSVDSREYQLQINGVATALSSPGVKRALFALPDVPVRIMVYEWSGPESIHITVPWTTVTTNSLNDIVETLLQTTRQSGNPGTGLGTAMLYGARALQGQPCWRRTLDISGDGKSNLGPRPRGLKDRITAMNVTVNALVIGADDPSIGDSRQTEIAELTAYFQTEVIVGPNAFVETALGFEDYARAMEVKLLRELDGLVFSQR